ncbi:hypothetical protein TWF132_003233 [Orbilia oligospora]|nr:hypothetical protein TWF132_003233 [Orbilia oligospora]
MYRSISTSDLNRHNTTSLNSTGGHSRMNGCSEKLVHPRKGPVRQKYPSTTQDTIVVDPKVKPESSANRRLSFLFCQQRHQAGRQRKRNQSGDSGQGLGPQPDTYPKTCPGCPSFLRN